MNIFDLFIAIFGYNVFLFTIIFAVASVTFRILLIYAAYKRFQALQQMTPDQRLQLLITLNDQGNQTQVSKHIHGMPTPMRDEVAHIAASNGIDPSFLYRS